MKRYLAFAGDTYYPSGGWRDFRGDFNLAGEAYAEVGYEGDSSGWWQIVDTKTGQIVQQDEESERDAQALAERRR